MSFLPLVKQCLAPGGTADGEWRARRLPPAQACQQGLFGLLHAHGGCGVAEEAGLLVQLGDGGWRQKWSKAPAWAAPIWPQPMCLRITQPFLDSANPLSLLWRGCDLVCWTRSTQAERSVRSRA